MSNEQNNTASEVKKYLINVEDFDPIKDKMSKDKINAYLLHSEEIELLFSSIEEDEIITFTGFIKKNPDLIYDAIDGKPLNDLAIIELNNIKKEKKNA